MRTRSQTKMEAQARAGIMPTSTVKKNTANFVKYVVVQTGYVDRLMNSKFVEWSKEDNVVMLEDSGCWKYGACGYTSEEKNEIKDFILTNNLDGVVVFRLPVPVKYTNSMKCDFDNFVDILSSKDYCAFCYTDCIYKRERKGNYMVIHVDCESG